MLKSRGAAVIGAFVLIALAIVVRGLLVGDDGGGGGSDGPKKADGDAPVVACTPDLVAVCDALADEGEIAPDPPELDLDEAADPPADVDAWITWNPAPAIANLEAGEPEVWAGTMPMGSATLAALGEGSNFDALGGTCAAEASWDCLATGAPAADLSIGVGDPTSAEGLARLAPLATALVPSLNRDDIDPAALRDIVDSPQIPQADASAMSLSAMQPAQVDFVIGPQRLLESRASSPQGEVLRLKVTVPGKRATAAVVLAPRAGADVGELVDACEDDGVSEALRAVGAEPCKGTLDDDLAGFLYNVRKEAS